MSRWSRVIEPFGEWVTDTGTAGALWPFSVGASQPIAGVPLGHDPHTGRVVCYDPLTEFQAGRQRATQLGVIATNGVGKSTLVKREALGFAAAGVPVIIAADFKGEYELLIEALGGSTQRITPTQGGINLVDPGETIAVATAANASAEVIEELKNRRNQLVATVYAINRRADLQDWEQAILGLALNQLTPGQTIHHLPHILNSQAETLAAAMAVSINRAIELIEPIKLSTMALIHSPIGQACGTSGVHQHWNVDNAHTTDTQTIPQDDPQLTAAVTTTCWTAAQNAIYYHNTKNPQPHALIFDEIWRATREFPRLNNRIGGLLRMDRHEGIITVLVTHSWTDTQQPGGSNILARCAAFALGGQQPAEINLIAEAGIGLTPPELAEIRRNSIAGTTASGQPHGGLGRFLIKQGDKPGQLVQTTLTQTERTLTNTNQQFLEAPV